MYLLVLGVLCLAGYVVHRCYQIFLSAKPLPKFPLIALDDEGLGPKASWTKAASRLLRRGFETTTGPFQISTGTGYKIVLPNKFAKELGRGAHLDNKRAIAMDYFPEYPGFVLTEEIHGMMVTFVQRKLTPNIDSFIQDIADEASLAIIDAFGTGSQWHQTTIKDESFAVELKTSSRVFLGPELCRDPQWLHITSNYAADYIIASFELRYTPTILRPLLCWVLPRCSRLRRHVREARKLFTPELTRRRKMVERLDQEDKLSKNDPISWMYSVARGKEVDFVALQLNLSLAAIHTTGDSLASAIADLCRHASIIPALREEIIQVFRSNDSSPSHQQQLWTRTTLKQLKLMDSFLKESSRASSAIVYSMTRYLRKDTELSNGDILPQGSRFMLTKDLEESRAYPGETNDFDAYRYVKRQAQLVEPLEENTYAGMDSRNLHFGYGEHVCPGRWFADINLKIALVHLVMRYDWRLPANNKSASFRVGQWEGISLADSSFKVECRRREVDAEVEGWLSMS